MGAKVDKLLGKVIEKLGEFQDKSSLKKTHGVYCEL